MKKETNVHEIRKMAKIFLHMPIKTDSKLPPELCVYHPFLQSSIISVPSRNYFVDVLKDSDMLKEYQEYVEIEIDNGDIYHIYALVRKPYRLAFIKYCEPFLSTKDLAEMFADAWVSSENPNQDVNCSIPFLAKMFKRCDKHHLMQEDDYAVYEALPETFTIYRGVAVGRNPYGLSWTRNLKTAKWFAHRFDTKDKEGYVQAATATKSEVLAYFNTRGEDEIVYNVKKKDISILEEVSVC